MARRAGDGIPAGEALSETASGTGSLVDTSLTAETVPEGARGDRGQTIGPGDCLGRYTVRTLIGAGGMGRVFAATDTELGRTVALKVIRPDRGASSAARARLLREAQALALLHHPNVVTVHDVGTEGEIVFIAMELIEGPTLGEWLRAERRTWRAIRDAFVAAGRGLAAAHAAGIVHRDFKPHNAIVGADRVVVVDFGLARAEAELPEEPGAPSTTSSQDSLRLALTLTGERVGTPRYMSPEQRAGGAVTARADQFAFCVALRDALFGDPPADAAASTDAAASADSAAPTAVRVPRFLAAAVARGLAPRPEDRWPSMDALLAALEHTLWTPRRRRAAGAAAIALVAGVAALGFTAGQRAAVPDPCVGSEALVAPLWDDAIRGRVHDAFRRTGLVYADDSFARVDTALRDRLAGWARTHRDNCEATHLRHEQSEAMLDLRAQCLGGARAQLGAMVAVLQQADATVVQRAARAAVEIADPARCSDPASLGAAIAPPPAAQAREVEAMRDEAARLSPQFELGKWQEARAAGIDLVARVRRLGYKPLLARALAQLAHVEANTGEVDTAIADLYEVAQLGAEVGDDDVVAMVLPWLGFALGNGKDRFDAADAVHRWAVAATARAGNTPLRLVSLYGNRAVVLSRQGDHKAALALYQTVLGLETQRRGPDSLGAAWSLKSIGDELGATGRSGEATAFYQRASALIEKPLGPAHPLVSVLLSAYGWNYVDLFEFDAAVPILERALAINEQTLGPDDVRVAALLYNLGVARLGQRRLPEARAALERAIRIHRAAGPAGGRHTAQNYALLGDVARKEGNPRLAHELAGKALEIHLAVLGPAHEETGLTYRLDADHLVALGRVTEARAAIDRARAIAEKAHGKDHPELGWTRGVEGDVLRAERRPREALAAHEASLKILEAAYGASFVGLCQPLSRLSAAALDTGDPRRAEALAERALVLAARAAPGEAETAQVRLAQARWALGADRPGALALARRARTALAALAFPSDELPRLDRWLASR